ncbi:c2h2 type zinc-finger protein [Cryptosporidium felis]|nr:c2h2 type zinc-finger protein [Cryptosporidium felis]
MYKRIALFSSELLADLSDSQGLNHDVEEQITKVYGDYPSENCHSDKKYLIDNSEYYKGYISDGSVNDTFIGKFKCIICPNKIIINESDLEKHLESKRHKRMVTKWTQQQENARKIRHKFNNDNNLVTKDDSLKEENIEESDGSNLDKSSRMSRKIKKKKVENLSKEQIIARKEKFKRKKERRIARRSE